MPDWPTGNLQIAGLLCLGYLSVVGLFRRRRYSTIHEKYTPKYKAGTLTLQDAQEIIGLSMMYDMPALMNYALAFALFKTYAIPSISKLLSDTQELSHPDKISKRYADTEICISTFMFCPISGKPMTNVPEDERRHGEDPRANIAIARVNWLHSRYKISNGDYLYTLCLFILEPVRWAERFGWRALSELERSALLMYWTEIGHRMNIKDIPETWEELVHWSQARSIPIGQIRSDRNEQKYEENMVPAQTNHDVASLTTEELLHVVPESFGIKNFARKVSICLLDDRTRIAMMQPAQPWYLHAFTRTVLHTFSFIQHHLCLPRSKGELIVSAEMPKFDSRDGPVRMHPTRWQPKPWYKPQAVGLWGSLKDRLAVLIGFYDEMPGKKYKTDGYTLEDIGPLSLEKAGREETMRMAEDMQGCPIRAPWFADLNTAEKVER
ncbi:uncharacterized protein ARMOST_00217 [Armillaria ostoyae]|uniref:Uncharacterized protein n=1 Tax=Armillaria ostoyae TaxID=47428 RepID=A0A284QKI0_ARMOS|nr:uncharacterized protein ARMOST_00217 [Armillaria ostoyae]